jgi:hypothetical protein
MIRWTVMLLASVLVFTPQKTAAQTARIGTFDRQAIVLAYYRSPLWAATLREKRGEVAEAKRANDTAKIEELNAWAGKAQELAHEQLWGNADIANVLDALQPAFAEMEASDHLSSVVVAPAPDAQAQYVDVTGRLLDWLNADETTRRMIRELHQGSNGT